MGAIGGGDGDNIGRLIETGGVRGYIALDQRSAEIQIIRPVKVLVQLDLDERSGRPRQIVATHHDDEGFFRCEDLHLGAGYLFTAATLLKGDDTMVGRAIGRAGWDPKLDGSLGISELIGGDRAEVGGNAGMRVNPAQQISAVGSMAA